jgi:uncharacterized membrane-anchored protein
LYAGDKDSLPVTDEKAIQHLVDSINASFKWQTGKIKIADNKVELNIPQGFRFMDARQSRYVLEDLWQNLKDSSILGMVFPDSAGPLSDGTWAFVLTFQKIGYVKDGDADKINYDDLLKQMKEESKEVNSLRAAQGMAKFDLLGWAQPPFYDKEQRVLHWAREFHAEGADKNTLNYDIRVLGRSGVLSINAIATMDQLPMVKANIGNVLKMAAFTEGNAYKDFDSNVDEVAAWTIGGLVAGKVLAKVGFFAIILKNIKLIILGIAAAGGGIWRFITGRRKKKEEEYSPVPVSPEENTNSNNA